MSETFSIDPAAHIGQVALTVSNVGRSEQFYRDVIGMRPVAADGGSLKLGADGKTPLLELTEVPGARRAPRSTGLYHFAILVPNRQALAASLRHLVDSGYPPDGAADHLVSEALYLSDPDGNGIEIYRDRPRSDWIFQNGEVAMDSKPLRGLMDEPAGSGPWKGLDPATLIGHIHLHVRDLPEAEHFYHDLLGFDVTAHYGPDALFVAAGGYHHHIGLNVWNGVGAPPPPPGSVGLRHFTVMLPDHETLAREKERLDRGGVRAEPRPDGFLVLDPSENAILFSASPSAA